MTDNDILILRLVNNSGDMATLGYYRSLDISADSRLQFLENQGLIKKHDKENDFSYAGDYQITGKGYAFLSDYDLSIQKSKEAKKRELLSNVYIPLIVTVIANLIIALIKNCI